MAPKKERVRSGEDWAPAFLADLAECGVITHAARRCGISRKQVYIRRDSDEAFRRQLKLALREACDVLEQEAVRRAKAGVLRPVFQGGRMVGRVREFSDTLLIFLLKSRRPRKFRDNVRVQHTGDAQRPVKVEATTNHVHRLPADGTAEVLRILLEAGALEAGAGGAADAPDALAGPAPADGQAAGLPAR